MKARKIIASILFTSLTIFLCIANYIGNKYILKAENIYKVYLGDEVIGYIQDDEELYNLINDRQKEIVKEYNVSKVYPPKGLSVINTNEYNVEVLTAEEIYNKISSKSSFTIEGYAIDIVNDEGKVINTINVLDKEIFTHAIDSFIASFVPQDDYENYINNTQPEIKETGKIIELMYFNETMNIKKGYISVDDKIYTDEDLLTQYLLFGENNTIKSYKVKTGDTIASISESNKLNPIEFLIANTKYTSEDSLLIVGDIVNITLINPILSLAYEVFAVDDQVVTYEKKTVYDSTKEPGYSEITTVGMNGIVRVSSEYKVVNGEQQSGVIITDKKTLVDKIDQVTTRGKYISGVSGNYVDTNTDYAWPTNQPYRITSKYSYRWGKMHDGIDISGTGYGSPIYAISDGVVTSSGNSNNDGGWIVTIRHDNGLYSYYAHMVPGSPKVSVGEHVSRGQIIGQMGQSGHSTGTHLHFGIWSGIPYRSTSTSYNPCNYYSGKC